MVDGLRAPRVPRRLHALPSHQGRLRERALTRVVAAAALFVALAVVVFAGVTDGADRAILALIQTPHPAWLDVFASVITLGGDPLVTAGVAAGLIGGRLVQHRPEALVPLAIGLTVVAEVALKAVIPHEQPPHELVRSIVFFPTIEAPVPFSFPSGHCARLAFLVSITRMPAWASASAILLMAVSRVYLAEHWPTDVVGGVLLGLAVAWTARWLARGQKQASR